jgi:5-hydroxyisourate hydrolase-like protein (transthyretin family)
MKKSIVFIVFTTVVLATFIFAQKSSITIAARWEKVNQLAEKQLPESALKEVQAILEQAQKEKNSPEVIKAMVYKMRFTLEKNPDEAPDLIKDFEAFTEKSTDPSEKALLHSMTADLYAQFYQKDQWTINNRTLVIGFVPDDIKEWTKNIYFDKISKHLAASLENATILQQTDALKFAALLEKGADSKELQSTLFDFLGNRKIEILERLTQAPSVKNPLENKELFAAAPQFVASSLDSVYASSVENQVVDTYRQLLAFRQKADNVPAFLYVDLQRLKYIKEHSESANSDSLYLTALNRLEIQYAANEAVVEVLAEKANYYLANSNDDENKSNKKMAYDICSDGLKRFPNYKRVGLLSNIQKSIAHKTIGMSFNQVAKPATTLKVHLNTTNISTLKLTVYRVNATALEYYNYVQNRRNEKTLYARKTLVETKQIDIKPDANFGNVTTEVDLKTDTYGIYEICGEAQGNENESERVIGSLTISDLAFINRTNVAKQASLYVLDRMSGKPESTVKVSVYENKWTGNRYSVNFVAAIATDKNGLCQYSFNSNYGNNVLMLEKGKDCYFTNASNSYFNERNRSESKDARINIFTDRSLYRPGQTVYFKAIVYYSNKTKQEIAAGVEYEATLFDANGQKVSAKKYKTNEFGSIAGEFVLPEGGLNGTYRIQVGTIFQSIWVEEYKRPTFEVTIDKPKTEISFGEKATVKATVKAYAGYTIADAKVKYRVVRSTHRYCWWWSTPDKEITNGITNSKADGTFEVSFTPEKTKSEITPFRNEQFYTYTIYVDVTDPKGETQQGQQYVSVGDKSLFVLAELAEKIDKKQTLNIEVSTETLNGEKVNSTIKYSLYRLEDSDIYAEKLDDKTVLKEGDKVLSGSFDTNNKKLNLAVGNFASGRYRLVFTTPDAHGKEVKLEKTFVLYDVNDKRPPVKSYEWFLASKTECVVGEKALIQFGTSTNNSSVLYEVMQGNTILESRWISFSDEIKKFEIPFKESYGAGVTVLFTFMKDEQFFSKQVQITRKVADKKLTPTLSVFRNKLLPGEKAEWTVTIPESAKDKKSAEVLVGMYDASLDALRPHSWNFNPSYRESVYYTPAWVSNGFGTTNDYAYLNNQFVDVAELKLNQLNWFGLNLGYRNVMIRGLASRGNRISVADVKGVEDMTVDIADVKMAVTESPAMNEVMTVGYGTQKNKNSISLDRIQEEKNEVQNTQTPIQIRTNFNEIAFFYPQLRTDAQGNVKFSFTAPESLTRWNVKMLAHTTDLFFGQGAEQVVTQKDLMVQMNLPRFVRRSDKLVLSANVVNLTDKDLKANVTFELIDPATDKIICTKSLAPLSLGRGVGGEVVSWELTEFSPYELVTCKVVARAGNFSDGEQKYLPVLPDKVLVTESMPLTVRGDQTLTFNFESLLKNGSKVDTKNLSVEFSSNPAWYAVQALPTISAPENDNALDYFTAYYANSLAAFIANSNPKIAATFDRWKKAGGSREALLSNLQKNTELKNMLLEETPWVMAAKDETEQKRQIALLFDLNLQKNQTQQYLDKLISLQLPSGAFSWFKGMGESRYVTQEIILNLARLNKLVGGNILTAYRLPLAAALNYLDLEIARDFDNLKKNNKNYDKEMSIGNMQLFYLHMRSEYPEIPVHVSAQAAVKFYTVQSEKYWTTFSLYGKAMMAVVAQRNGKIQVANDILKSLRENALKTDEFGMYWEKNASGYYWNERPIAVQAAIIEAFAEVEKNTTEVDEMKIWLLKQKQTQRWDSPMATVDAIYALLHQGSDWLGSEGSVQIKVGNTLLRPSSTEAGTGYFKETIPVASVRGEMGKVTISNIEGVTQSHPLNKSFGWGAMYWQYYQDLDKVSGQGSALKITKKLFVEKMTSTGKTMLPIEQAKLVKGDKVITRLVITTDRNLEFVALKDLRASCFEPVNQLSGCEWKEGVCYYQTTKDASTQFFFSFLPKGTYVFEYELWANAAGEYTSGIASVQCQYAPEFVSHTGGERIKVN